MKVLSSFADRACFVCFCAAAFLMLSPQDQMDVISVILGT